eukprot:1070469-Prorocentrum_minimum.AAC.2
MFMRAYFCVVPPAMRVPAGLGGQQLTGLPNSLLYFPSLTFTTRPPSLRHPPASLPQSCVDSSSVPVGLKACCWTPLRPPLHAVRRSPPTTSSGGCGRRLSLYSHGRRMVPLLGKGLRMLHSATPAP